MKFSVNKKLVERWKKSLNSRDIPKGTAVASIGCAFSIDTALHFSHTSLQAKNLQCIY